MSHSAHRRHTPPHGTKPFARLDEHLTAVALVVVVVALLALAVAPIALLREMDGMRAHTAATSERAQSEVMDLRLLFAEEIDQHEAFLLRHGPETARAYRELRARERRSLATLETLADATGPRVAAQVDSLRALTSRWHRLPDGSVQGVVDDAAFRAAVPVTLALRDSIGTAMRGLDRSLAEARASDMARGGRVLERQRVIFLAVGLLALLGTSVVFWFARRDRMLGRDLAHALEEEARARAVAESRRAELERVTESKSRLMRGFTHDVKNPIGAADGFLQLLEDGLMDPLTDRQMASVGRARRTLDSALRLIEDLLELARAETGQLEVRREPVDLAMLAREVLEEYRAQAERKGLAVGLDLRADPLVAHSDPVRLRQVLGNLVSNAVKYTERGSVTVRVAAPADDRRASIEVADTGAGIPVNRQGLVFQEFVRLDPYAAPGAGVGLAISQRIAQALDAEITLSSEAGRGSSFVIRLPLDAPEARPAA